MSLYFLIFFLITTLRKIPQYVIEAKITQAKEKTDSLLANIIFVLYTSIWLISLYFAYEKSFINIVLVYTGLAFLLIAIILRFSALYFLRNSYSRTTTIYEGHKL